MVDAVIVSTARTALAKSWKGAFNLTHGATLGGHVVQHAIARAGIEPGAVEDVLMGCANPEGATGFNIARQIALRAGCPVSTPGMTVNRFCSSGLQTIALAAQRIMTGEGEIYVAGGVESISCVQNDRMNLFMAKDGVVATPVLNGTFLAGVTRQRVIQLLRDDGKRVEERTIGVADVMDADEVFSTGNYGKVQPATRIEDRVLQPGPLFRRAHELYFDYAKRCTRPAAL